MDAPARMLTSSLVLHGYSRLGQTAPGFQLAERYPTPVWVGLVGPLPKLGRDCLVSHLLPLLLSN